MANAPVISNFLTANKTGLVDNLEVLAKEIITPAHKYKEIRKLDIKTGLSFNGLTELCVASFSDNLAFKSLKFYFHNKHFTKNLTIWFDKDLNFVKTMFGCSKTGGRIQEADKHRFGAILEEDLLKVLMAIHTGHKEVMEELLPELHIEGAYDFASESFKQRVSLANMVLI
jgi:hypothetical protein